jgi:hypothetical protein
MTRNPTTNEEGALLVKKLLDEATPVLAYLIGGIAVQIRGLTGWPSGVYRHG